MKIFAAVSPPPLDIDTYDGQGWISVVPLRTSWVRLRGLPPLPLLSASLELNVRTYVTAGGRPGVFFLSVHAANPAAVLAGRLYHLPFFWAKMSLRREGETIHYHSRRASAEFRARYGPVGEIYGPAPGTLDYWLVERTCFYAIDLRGRLARGDIQPERWPLQAAWDQIDVNTMAQVAGNPILHFAREVKFHVWPLKRVALQ